MADIETATDVRKLILALAGYEEEIKRVRAIDPEAADYMDGPARSAPRFFPWTTDMPVEEAGWLCWAFPWSDTPQGRDYWGPIQDELHPGWND